MKLLIEIDDDKFSEIAHRTVTKLLVFNEHYAGDAARYVEEQTKTALNKQLNEINFAELVQQVSSQFIRGIVEDVTREEIKKYARAVVKSMKDKGELI